MSPQPGDLGEDLRRAFDAAFPHLLAAGRELVAAYHAFMDALADGADPGPQVERVTIE